MNAPAPVPLLDRPSRSSRLFGLLHLNKTLFLRRYWTDDLPEGALPTARQVQMFMDTSRQAAVVSGRKVLKTTFIESLILGEPLRHRGKRIDALFVTPADNHMNPVLARIEHKLNSTPIFHSMIESYNKNDGILKFRSGYWWYFRIEGVDGSGRNMVGLRCDLIVGDEMAFGAQKAHDARVQVARSPTETKWLYTGVPNGVRLTTFWQIDQDPEFSKAWHVHRFSSFENPAMGNPAAREALKVAYKDENEYLNNVLGQWGEERASTFPSLHVAYSQALDQPYKTVTITDRAIAEQIAERGEISWSTFLSPLFAQAAIVGGRADMAALGIDFGFSPDPSEIIVAYRDALASRAYGDEVWRCLGRVTLRRVEAARQAGLVDALRSGLDAVLGGRVRHICADMAGYGMAIYADHLFSDPRYDGAWYRDHTTATAFGSTESEDDEYGQPRKDRDGRVVKRRRKQTATELLKEAFAANARNVEQSSSYHA